MKTIAPTLVLAAGLTATALILLPRSQADEPGIGEIGEVSPDAFPAPIVPEGTEMTPDVEAAIVLIATRLIDPVRRHSNARALMSRTRVRMDIEYHFALTAPEESRIPFDVYQRHRRGGWEKVASGICHPGMESIKVAMPETGAMVDPIEHPLFAAALIAERKAH